MIYWTVTIRHQFSYQTHSKGNTTTYRNKIGILLYLFQYRGHSKTQWKSSLRLFTQQMFFIWCSKTIYISGLSQRNNSPRSYKTQITSLLKLIELLLRMYNLFIEIDRVNTKISESYKTQITSWPKLIGLILKIYI